MTEVMAIMNDSTAEGFTMIEAMVTLFVVTIFIIGFFQTYLILESQRLNVARQAKASDIAYTNLRKFSIRPAGLACNASTMDLTAADSSTKTGELLGDQSNVSTSSAYGFIAEPPAVTNNLGGTITQEVRAFAPNGCANFASNPIKIVSSVTWGNGERVTHASFVQ